MKKIIILSILLISVLFALQTHAQVGIGTKTPDKSAVLDVSGAKGGFLPPRMTSLQRLNIIQPAKGLMVFDNDSDSYFYFDGTQWKGIGSGNFSIAKLTELNMIALKSPSQGTLVYNLDSAYFFYFNGKIWEGINPKGGSSGPWTSKNTDVFLNQLSNSVGIGNNSPDSSAVLDISSSSKGVLVSRMTSVARVSIKSPAKGLL